MAQYIHVKPRKGKKAKLSLLGLDEAAKRFVKKGGAVYSLTEVPAADLTKLATDNKAKRKAEKKAVKTAKKVAKAAKK